MQVIKCPNGHSYDRDKYTRCPHCGAEAEKSEPKTAKLDLIRAALEKTTPSQLFASGAVFDISRQQRGIFEKIVCSENAGLLL